MAKVEVTVPKDTLEAFAYIVGFFVIATVPSWTLIYFGKPSAALAASAIPLALGFLVVFFFRYAFI